MSLNIKNPEAHLLAKELAGLTGESVTEAVMVALRERLKRERRRRDDTLFDRLMAISEDAGKRWKEPYRSMTHQELDDLLYDERGLPK